MPHSEELIRKNTFQTPQLSQSPRNNPKLTRQDILNDVANFRADKLHNINFARQVSSKDNSPTKTGRKSPYNQMQLKRLVTYKEEKQTSRGRVGASLELDYDYQSQPLYSSANRQYQRSRSEIKREDLDDFGYDDPSPLLGDRDGIHITPEEVQVNKASRNRYNLRRLPGHQKSLLLDK